jgi:hypothetical protein
MRFFFVQIRPRGLKNKKVSMQNKKIKKENEQIQKVVFYFFIFWFFATDFCDGFLRRFLG